MDCHTACRSCCLGAASQLAIFAESDTDKLVIFVHGFGGSATKTWRGMDVLLDDPRAKSADVLFYGYESLAAQAHSSATLFRKFLSEVASTGPQWLETLKSAGARGNRNYKDVLIVAHSLGAVVARRALLDTLASKPPWMQHTRLLLFGPAHKGTRLLELTKMLSGTVGSVLMNMFAFGRVKTPVLDDLEENSAFLVNLLAESEAAAKAGCINPVKAEAVIFGEKDYVVRMHPFCTDPQFDVWEKEDHCSVCRTDRTVPAVAAHL